MNSTNLPVKSITELISVRARDNADDTFVYTGDASDGNKVSLRSLTFKEGVAAVDRLAWHYSKLNICPKPPVGEVPPVQVISVLTSSSIDETLLEIALAKLGLTALLLAANNSVTTVAHLIKLTKATHLIYGAKFEATAKEASATLAAQDYYIEIIPEAWFPLWGPQGVSNSSIEPFAPYLSGDQEASRPAVILHSSGSTGFPKPVFLPHSAMVYISAHNQFSAVFSTLPVFHGAGHFLIFASIYAGGYVCIFPPHLPLTPANICEVIAQLTPRARQIFAVPYVVKLLGETEEGVRAMAAMDFVATTGAPIPNDLGDRLVTAGVNLMSLYGATEIGSLMTSVRNYALDKLWNWVRPSAVTIDYLVFEPQGDDTFELVIKDGFPTKVQTNRPDGSYATKDLFRRHPDHPNFYQYLGRLDDTLVHSLGEKTNPVPMENCIRGNSPFVKEAIVFGAGRSQTGCLILPADEGENMTTDEFLDMVWPVIEQANEEAPSHSRIVREMVEILPHDTVIPVAPKMSIVRPACYAKFADIIDSVYKRMERDENVGEKKKLFGVELEDYLFKTVSSVLDTHHAAGLNLTVDLFAFGVDSLHASRIHNHIQQEIDLGEHKVGSTVVYDHPSIKKLAAYLEQLQSGGTVKTGTDHEKMLSYVEKWLAEVKPRSVSGGQAKPTDARVVVLTGATGSLGVHILSRLTASSAVRKVICLSRAKSHEDSLSRLRRSAVLRKVQIDEKKMISYSATVQAPFLGLTEEQYDELKSEVTDIVHNAWPVNFVMNVDSFDEHIGGAANLMNLALETPWSEPATFLFSSSIACRMASPGEFCDENFPQTPATAAGSGYAQSKWVVEKLSEKAHEKTGLPVAVLRIGQMSGDSVNGIWNETEAWPLLFKSANTVGALPVVDEHPSWLPVDYAGEAIVEIILNASKPAARVYNIVNPNTETNFEDMLDWIAEAGLEVTDVIHNAWPVNFVMNIDSFDEHIGGAVNLMNLALETPWAEPATFLFSSSISSRMASPEEFCDEDFPQTPATAAGTGYAQSKWVVEKLSEKASEKTGLPVAVTRIGQMSGDSVHGIWNETEAWPLLIKSANTIGALPVVDEHPSWLPVDYAGEAIAEITLNVSKPAARVYNIVNPNTETNFKDMVEWIAEAGLKFDKVDRLAWLDRLATSEQEPAKNPTIKLLGFFNALYGSDFRQQIVFRTDETLKWGPALGRAPPITKEIVAKWIGHWKETGFLQ
ncbi:L-aminoadipate-semialdehyde dehydrogenase [Cylindrobasidium torrendii FP15055 ss-10]|uniref:L-aminoadipate-semialdehyde dehydrogenase n=1 Tax=Cylindrobasidium torrendii FP15055 ss-10 TaxID=1314674 RepID=A0A0D7AZ08_9AGAR|nr:L-aminoadipate-semialdehyde dehydrogenase [Cylindrobasidium torrendii FP15055 ss-10]